MANLYLSKGAEAQRQGAKDLSEPLIELAKQQYRELLRADSQDWSAKYNLERALQLLPDLEQEPPADDLMPERSPRAVGTVESVEQLP
jgi:mxaK protein